MATVQKTPRPSGQTPEHKPDNADQLRRDRIFFAIMVVAIIALFALVLWVASIGPPPEGMDYGYPMFP